MISPDVRSTWRGARSFLFTVLMLGASQMAVAWMWIALGWIGIDELVGMLIGGVVVVTAGTATAVLWVVWSHLRWLRLQRRMRRNLLGSLSGTPQLAAAEGRTSPVDAAGLATSALPDSSTITNLDQYRRQL